MRAYSGDVLALLGTLDVDYESALFSGRCAGHVDVCVGRLGRGRWEESGVLTMYVGNAQLRGVFGADVGGSRVALVDVDGVVDVRVSDELG